MKNLYLSITMLLGTPAIFAMDNTPPANIVKRSLLSSASSNVMQSSSPLFPRTLYSPVRQQPIVVAQPAANTSPSPLFPGTLYSPVRQPQIASHTSAGLHLVPPMLCAIQSPVAVVHPVYVPSARALRYASTPPNHMPVVYQSPIITAAPVVTSPESPATLYARARELRKQKNRQEGTVTGRDVVTRLLMGRTQTPSRQPGMTNEEYYQSLRNKHYENQ